MLIHTHIGIYFSITKNRNDGLGMYSVFESLDQGNPTFWF